MTTSGNKGLRWGPQNLAQLLFWASTTSALSLANFQIITSNRIPTTCILVYSSPIQDCQAIDFTNGHQCSADCIDGLAKTSTLVNAVCGGLNVDPTSLLGLTLNGQLVDTLCPGARATTTTVTVRPTATTKGLTTIQSETTKSQQTTPTIESTTSTILTPTSTSVITQSTTSQDPPPATTTVADSITSQPSTSQQTTAAASTEQSTSQTSDSGGGGKPKVTGGGSPFDAVQAFGTHSHSKCASEALLVAIFAALVLLLQ